MGVRKTWTTVSKLTAQRKYSTAIAATEMKGETAAIRTGRHAGNCQCKYSVHERIHESQAMSRFMATTNTNFCAVDPGTHDRQRSSVLVLVREHQPSPSQLNRLLRSTCLCAQAQQKVRGSFGFGLCHIGAFVLALLALSVVLMEHDFFISQCSCASHRPSPITRSLPTSHPPLISYFTRFG